ncbi:MAG: 2-dehydro-3-deoxyphosphogluconate aldolase [Ignavibacteriae bacterium HGW-Ignavibacteriae-2]|jgi:2-dehydro-3-deoxyphosphogluconate aldolase/(4S)-4-hydroxy-2-oxoglutarate aldolase|nr:bifunctional 4-hydroxy-2-oxoglutarate aldolase/2-dehydro-3-deoxy-phosphogluconate aldolase [Bacteroidota bacterium]PKL90270.1 MAG: 2-dehydro-3-deoxyphosphogluconate aldolase [Ignavibacteriae bacterium HGW-Ignavibacteriae-2]
MSRNEILQAVLHNKAFAVVRLNDSTKVLPVVEAIIKGGIKNIELTLTTPNSFEILPNLVKEFENDSVVGVGSVLTTEQVSRSIELGAKYIVSPVFIKSIIDIAHQNDVAVMSGAFSPTEIFNANEYGSDIVKVFPADILGMAFFKGIKAPMPHLKIMPTGGVSLTNAGEWIKAGACAVGIGSALMNEDAIENGDYDLITNNAEILMKSINEACN